MAKTNPILTIPKHRDFDIPIYFADDIKHSYLSQLKKRYSRIISFLQVCKVEHFEPSLKEFYITRITDIQNAILEIFKTYLSGFPAEAYHLFRGMLEEYKLGDEINSLQQHKVPKNSYLFRMQSQPGNTLVNKHKGKAGFLKIKDPADMFHPPFQRRRSIGTNRFSISGYPCLYLSEELITSYSECFSKDDRPNHFSAICFKNLRPLYFIDFSNKKLNPDPLSFGGILDSRNHNKDVGAILDHLGIYQLIIATHTKIQYKPFYEGEKYYFKAEYIIPQLLLQWLKHEGFAIDGIRYRSCTGAKRFPGKADHYNYVLPVQSSADSGFCPSLAAVLLPSEVYSCLLNKKPASVKLFIKNIANKLKGSNFGQANNIVFK